MQRMQRIKQNALHDRPLLYRYFGTRLLLLFTWRNPSLIFADVPTL